MLTGGLVLFMLICGATASQRPNIVLIIADDLVSEISYYITAVSQLTKFLPFVF